MRNFKKVIALVIAVALMMSTFTVAFAAETTETSASKLVTLGLLSDASDASLSAGLTREIGLTMILKALGYKQADADKAAAAPFTDTKGWVTAWANLAYEKGITKGATATTFAGSAELTGNQFVTFALRAFGVQVTDTTKAAELAITAGLLPAGATIAADFTKANAADVMFAAMTMTVPGTTPAVRLIDKLVKDGVVTEANAVKAGLVADKLAITSAAAVSAKSIKVTFNKAVADTSKVTFAAKKDGSPVTLATTTWNEAKTEATVSVSYKLFAGKYVVTATENTVAVASPEFEVKDSSIASITFTSDNFVLSNDTTITTSIKIVNQYGDDITNDFTESNLNIVPSKVDNGGIDLDKGVITLTSASKYVVDEKVTVTVVDPSTAVTSSKQLVVSAAVNVASIEIGDVTTSETQKEIYVSTDLSSKEYYLPLVVKDQYGNAITNAVVLESALSVIVSDAGIANQVTTDIYIKDGKAALRLVDGSASKDGTVTITIVSKSGKSASKNVVVKADGKLDTLTFSQPEGLLKENVAIAIPFVAVDQYGTTLTKAEGLLAYAAGNGTNTLTMGPVGKITTVTVTNATINYSVDYKNNNAAVIKITPTSKDQKVVMVVTTPTAKSQTITMSVNAAPVSQTISKLSTDFYKGMQEGLTQQLAIDKVTLKDQYGDDKSLTAGYTLTVTEKDAAVDRLAVTNAGFPYTFTATTDKTGSKVFVITLKDNTNKTLDTYEFTMENVPLKDITEFGVKNLNKIYTGSTFVNGNSSDDYDQTIAIYGKKGATDILVNQNLIVAVTSPVLTIDGTDIVQADNDSIDTGKADKTTTISVSVAGASSVINCTKEVTYSNAAPKAASLIVTKKASTDEVTDSTVLESLSNIATNDVVGTDTAYRFYAKDQYSVVLEALNYAVSNIADADKGGEFVAGDLTIAPNGTITNNGPVEAGDSYIITVVVDGLVKSVKVIAE